MSANPVEPSARKSAELVASFAKANRPPASPQAQAARPNVPDEPVTTTKPAPTPPAATITVTEPPAPPPPVLEPAPLPPPAEVPPDAAQQVERVIALVNEERAKIGIAPLTVDERLTAAALQHSTDMANREYFDHTSPEGVRFDQRIREAGYLSPGAENIARGQQSAAQVMKAWMESPGHAANILNPALTTIGVALVTDGYYWTQDFGR
ncbi:MAG TPA: CAP domain-containing protein [Actinophytocola sp.]|uniref:CAP domain-containing protein n=1 Tax=Actinophytocola sp. TaxID=1872138 RepID=UPI002DBB7E53|nr:CAP domain-containing protein [Actinophytocola sp.]HEU5475056.1 CAP domain-containing protein [Actinophytocola sp.]